MQLFKKALPLFAAIALAVLTLGCGAPAAAPDDTGTASEGLASVNGTKYTVTSGEDQIIPAEIVVDDGMSLSFFGRLDEGEVYLAALPTGQYNMEDFADAEEVMIQVLEDLGQA